MEPSRNGGGKVVAFQEAMIGRHRNGSRSTYLDIGRDVDAGRVARPLQPQGAVSRRRTYADGELDVFSAERYFKGSMDGGDHRKEYGVPAVVPPPAPLEKAAASARPAVGVAKPVETRASTASVSASSATSANSRTMLLRGGRSRRDHRDKKCCVQVGALMRSCSGKRSVGVDSDVAKEVPGAGEPAASKIDWYKELRMQKDALGIAGDGSSNHGVVAAALPPNLNNLGTAKVAAIGREVIREDKVAEFITSSSSRRRSFTLVAPVRGNVPANGRGGGNEHEDGDDDGAGSESSSDLFEIKSLMIDDCPYEPSEASIQWSVATASAADASERGDRVSARWITGAGSHRGRDRGMGPVAGRQNWDRPPAALLSGCVSHRAVEVSAVTTAVPNAPRRRCEGFQKARNVA